MMCRKHMALVVGSRMNKPCGCLPGYCVVDNMESEMGDESLQQEADERKARHETSELAWAIVNVVMADMSLYPFLRDRLEACGFQSAKEDMRRNWQREVAAKVWACREAINPPVPPKTAERMREEQALTMSYVLEDLACKQLQKYHPLMSVWQAMTAVDKQLMRHEMRRDFIGYLGGQPALSPDARAPLPSPMQMEESKSIDWKHETRYSDIGRTIVSEFVELIARNPKMREAWLTLDPPTRMKVWENMRGKVANIVHEGVLQASNTDELAGNLIARVLHAYRQSEWFEEVFARTTQAQVRRSYDKALDAVKVYLWGRPL